MAFFTCISFSGQCIDSVKTLPELAELSDVIITFKVSHVELSEHYLVFKNGIKKNYGKSIKCYGFAEKIIKNHRNYNKNKFFRFEITMKDNTKEYDSAGNILSMSTPLYCKSYGDAFSVLPYNVYLCFLGLNETEQDTSFYLRRILNLNRVCELHAYIGNDNDLLDLCKLQEKNLDEEKQINKGIEKLKAEIEALK